MCLRTIQSRSPSTVVEVSWELAVGSLRSPEQPGCLPSVQALVVSSQLTSRDWGQQASVLGSRCVVFAVEWMACEHTLHLRAGNVCGVNGCLRDLLVKCDLLPSQLPQPQPVCPVSRPLLGRCPPGPRYQPPRPCLPPLCLWADDGDQIRG